jgi:hypothetical protein
VLAALSEDEVMRHREIGDAEQVDAKVVCTFLEFSKQ